MSYQKRNLTKSVKVREDLFNKFRKIVEEKTEVKTYWGKNYYHQNFEGSYYTSGKFTLADLLEKALKEFIDKNT